MRHVGPSRRETVGSCFEAPGTFGTSAGSSTVPGHFWLLMAVLSDHGPRSLLQMVLLDLCLLPFKCVKPRTADERTAGLRVLGLLAAQSTLLAKHAPRPEVGRAIEGIPSAYDTRVAGLG